MSYPPTLFRPNPDRLALVVIDIQEKLAAVMPPKVLSQVARNTNLLLATAQEFNLPVIVTEQYRRGLGATVEEIHFQGQHSVIDKISFSCCGEPAFQQALSSSGRRDVILCGMEAHICVLQTALDLLEEGRQVFIAADAVCSRTKLNWELGLEMLRQAGAIITPAETIVFQLLGAAGNERFKRLAPLAR